MLKESLHFTNKSIYTSWRFTLIYLYLLATFFIFHNIREVEYEIVECSRDDALLRGPPRTSWLLAKTGKTFFGQKVPQSRGGGGPLYFFNNILYNTKSQNNNNLYQYSSSPLANWIFFCPRVFFLNPTFCLLGLHSFHTKSSKVVQIK